MDVIFVRAELVSRGGDFDARDGNVRLPPLVIDLPKMYGPLAVGGASVAQFAPYLSYIRDIDGNVLPQAGQAVFTANTRGYLFEAREYTLPNGKQIREWHVPLDLVITISPSRLPAGTGVISALPAGGVVWKMEDGRTERIEVAPGSSVVVGRGFESKISAPAQRSTAEAAPAVSVTGGTQLEEFLTSAAIDRDLIQPAPLLLAKRSFSFTLDPGVGGQGFLGLRSFAHVRTGKTFLDLATVPYVIVNGETIPLDRTRLVDLRVLPSVANITIGFTGRGDAGNFSFLRARFGNIRTPGLQLEAVYDLGANRYAFVSAFGEQAAPEDFGNSVGLSVTVTSLTGSEPAEISGVVYGETGQPGPIAYDGQTKTTEFAGPAKALRTPEIRIGGGASGGGQLTLVRGGFPITSTPIANPSQSIVGAPVGVYVTPLRPSTNGFYASSISAAIEDTSLQPITEVKPIGQPCGTPQVIDDATADAMAEVDIERAWFEFDGAKLYTTIQVAQLSPTGGAISFRSSWRFEHVGFGMQAVRDALGNWTYTAGLHPSAGSAFNPISSIPVTGELQFGTPGFIRLSQRSDSSITNTGFVSGELLRHTGATSFNVLGVADRAPAGAPESAFGRGEDFLVAPCNADSTVQLLRAASSKEHGPAGTFAMDLPLVAGPGIEGRSGGMNGNHTIVFTFATSLANVGNTTITSGNGSVSSSAIDASDPHRFVVELTGVTDAQLLTLNLSAVTDTPGNVTPNVSLTLGFLLGDTAGNGSVNSSDIGETKSNSGKDTTALTFHTDVNTNGVINSSDIGLVKSRSGNSLP